MNEIRVKQMILGGLATLVVWVAIELLVELLIARALLGYHVEDHWPEMANLPTWSAPNYLLNLLIGVLNSTLLIWLYASLRPMYGVGTRTALITSAFGFIWGTLLIINLINLGVFPATAGLVEAGFLAIEFPIAMIVGAGVYEGTREGAPT